MTESVHSVRLLIRRVCSEYALAFNFIQVYVFKNISLRFVGVLSLKINNSYKQISYRNSSSKRISTLSLNHENLNEVGGLSNFLSFNLPLC